MTLTQIWKYLNVEAPSITRAITRLETLGWVERLDGEDKREKKL
ncbi:MarR family transcriptional regulator [Lysinibacillus sp. MHQ-1]|nr:MarR family transcriptional regulator [Lysinibacillus sp. MHQ-1]